MNVDKLEISSLTIPTDAPESDGTKEWDSTTIVIVEARCGATTGLGFTYAPSAAASVVDELLRSVVEGRSLDELGAIWLDMGATLRNAGRPGIAWCALSAVDVALWDLRARLLGQPLAALLPACHEEVPVYGSGGTSGSQTASITNGRSAANASSQADSMRSGDSTRTPSRPISFA